MAGMRELGAPNILSTVDSEVPSFLIAMAEKKWYLHYTDPIPDDLLQAIKGSRCVALVGAGVRRRSLSKARVPLPGWINLLEGSVPMGSAKREVGRTHRRRPLSAA